MLGAAACEGVWTTNSTPSPVRAIHGALMHTGKVLLIAGSGNDENQFAAGTFTTAIYDPATGTLRSDIQTPYDMFCSGHAFLPDGRLLVAGGTLAYPDNVTGQGATGEKRVRIFDPVTERYRDAPSMAIGRWYPTVVSRADGRLVTLAGVDDGGRLSNTFQTFNPSDATWSSNEPIGTWPNGIGVYSPMYPSMHLLADGRLFYSGMHVFPNASNTRPYRWDVDTNTVTWMDSNSVLDVNRRDQGASVLLPPAQAQKVMVIGGGQETTGALGSASTAVIDLTQPNPTYTPGPPIDAAKMYVSAVILPDGRVLQTGGASSSRWTPGSAYVKSTQILDPKTMTWTKAFDAKVGRTYHSGAMLLPDGRVLTFGGNPAAAPFEMNLELFSPSYIHRTRPAITSAPTEVTWGAGFPVTTDAPITSATLIRPSAVTHSSDSDQRSVELTVSGASATRPTLTIPANHNLTPTGRYMLFVRSGDGTPSVASWVHVA